MPHNDDYEEDAAPLNTGSDVVNLDVDHDKLIKGVRTLLRQKPLITVSLVDRMMGNKVTAKTQIKSQIPEGVDLSRFDETLKNTVTRG